MKNTKKTKTWLGAALLALCGLAGRAQAASNPAFLNIDIAISASMSVSVNDVPSSTDTSTTWSGTPNQAVAPTSTVTVKND